jgi:hypothetical protein
MAVCTFNPEREIVNIIAKIPLRFNQIKACVHGRNIYVASDEGVIKGAVNIHTSNEKY